MQRHIELIINEQPNQQREERTTRPIMGASFKDVRPRSDHLLGAETWYMSNAAAMQTMCGGTVLSLIKVSRTGNHKHPSLTEPVTLQPSSGYWSWDDWDDEGNEDSQWILYDQDEVLSEFTRWARNMRGSASIAEAIRCNPWISGNIPLVAEDRFAHNDAGYGLITLIGPWTAAEIEEVRQNLQARVDEVLRPSSRYRYTLTELRKGHDFLISGRFAREKAAKSRVRSTAGNFGWSNRLLADPNFAVPAQVNRKFGDKEAIKVNAYCSESGDTRTLYTYSTEYHAPNPRGYTDSRIYRSVPTGQAEVARLYRQAVARQLIAARDAGELKHIYFTDNCLIGSRRSGTYDLPEDAASLNGTKSLIAYLSRYWRSVRRELELLDPGRTWSMKQWPLASNPNESNHDICGMSVFID